MHVPYTNNTFKPQLRPLGVHVPKAFLKFLVAILNVFESEPLERSLEGLTYLSGRSGEIASSIAPSRVKYILRLSN